MRYIVYQRRLLVEALKTKAMLYAMLGEAEPASKAAKDYFEVAFPTSKDEIARATSHREKALADLERMGPLRLVNGKLMPGLPGDLKGFPSTPKPTP